MGASKWFFSMSGVILLIGALAIGGKGLNFGIDFESGTRIRAELAAPPTRTGCAARSRPTASATPRSSASAARARGKNSFQISTSTLSERQRNQIGATCSRSSASSPTTSTSSGRRSARPSPRARSIAIIASLLVISIYIALRFEWKYAVPVLIALMHDILITAACTRSLGREVTTSTVAALLTILGYSLYDTIIVFDRVRENVPRMPRAAFSQIVNRSMSEVLTRSLATSFCTALPIAALLFFGGDTLKDFAFALLVGVISGAYSSIFIASPVLTHWKERETVYVRRRRAHRRGQRRRRARLRASARAARRSTCAPAEKARAQRRVTEPDDPQRGVSQDEFQEMVRDLHVEAPPTATAERDPSADLDPEDLVLKDDKAKARQVQAAPQAPPREEPLAMAMLAWVMMGLAIWHFTIFLPDRFWGGIVGAFLGALLGAIDLRPHRQRLHDPRPERHARPRPSRRFPAR